MENSITDFLNICLILLNAFVLYKVYYSNRKSKFEDTLYEMKLKIYIDMLDQIDEITTKLDYSSHPFDSIHQIKSRIKWENHCKTDILPLIEIPRNFLKKIFREYSLVLPGNIIELTNDFAFIATRMIVEASHFEAGVILEKFDRMIDKKFEILNAMRDDLSVNIIDETLRSRLMEKNI